MRVLSLHSIHSRLYPAISSTPLARPPRNTGLVAKTCSFFSMKSFLMKKRSGPVLLRYYWFKILMNECQWVYPPLKNWSLKNKTLILAAVFIYSLILKNMKECNPFYIFLMLFTSNFEYSEDHNWVLCQGLVMSENLIGYHV